MKAMYLMGARVSEMVSYASPSDIDSPGHKGQPRGPRGNEYTLAKERGEKVVVFKLKTGKRDGKPRNVALPLDPKYEPWTEEVLNYYIERGRRKVFPFTRQITGRWCHKTFKGLVYPIEPQITHRNGVRVRVKAHLRPFGTHALRHLRATELVEVYGFDVWEICQFCGWSLKTLGPQHMSRYLHLQWRRYFPKLLKERN